MEPTGLLVFATTLFIAAAAPGPGIAAIVARVLGRGTRGAAAFGAGLAVGDVVWLTCAIAGLAALAQAFHEAFLVVRYLGAAYLLWMAWRLWTAPATTQAVEADDRAEHPARPFLAGLAVTMGNPKVMVFYLALLPTFLDLTRITSLGYAELVATILAVLAVVFSGYIGLASRARRLFTSPRAVRILNRTTGTVMAGAAAAVVAR